MEGIPAQSSITYSPSIAAWSEVPMPSSFTLRIRPSCSSLALNSLKVTAPSSWIRPRRTLAAASGVSWISFSMKWSKPPFCACDTSQSTAMIFGSTATPSRVVTWGPTGLMATISPSPRTSTRLV